MKLLVAALLGMGLMVPMLPLETVAAEPKPSFDCRNARAADEKAVCGSVELAELDRLVTVAYAGFEPEFGDKKDIARGILADRKDCGDEVSCIAAVYANALSTYAAGTGPLWPSRYAQALMLHKAEDVAAAQGPVGEMPRQVGDCTRTTIEALTDRFGAPLASAEDATGSAVAFSNGGSQVSYAREDALFVSEVGDKVTSCLVARQRDCPEGDDRGNLYVTVNEDKHVSWVLTDTQHICGGA